MWLVPFTLLGYIVAQAACVTGHPLLGTVVVLMASCGLIGLVVDITLYVGRR